MTPPMPPEVAAAFAALPEVARGPLAEARAALFRTAAEVDAGPLTETLRWRQPAYLTAASKSGTTVRLGLDGGHPAVLFHCQTALVEGFRTDLPEAFTYAGNRALHLRPGYDPAALALCLARALTYHRDKRRRP